jgi:hypothetical protein
MTTKFTSSIAAAAAALLIAGCGGGGIGGSGSAGTMGTLNVSITDAPACGYDAVNVSVQKVRVHQSAGAADSDSGWSEVVLSPAKRVNLLALTNGVLENLGQTALPAGKYTQLRLVLADNSSATPLANSVVPTGGAETALDTPSAAQSGLKINLDLDVAADKIADLVLDFDACKSVVRRGNSGQFNLKPVVTAIPALSDAGLRVVGYVDPSIGTATTSVSVQTAGMPVKATAPDATGKFVLYPVPVGSYDLVVAAAGHVTAVMTGVPVTTTSFTTVNSAALPIAPAVSTLRSVAGTVTPATATVRATQTFNGGPKVEVSWGVVDATSGAFTFSLPIQAPVKTSYVANPVALNFVTDSTAAGKYTLEASSAGATKTQAIDVSAAVPAVTFSFP